MKLFKEINCVHCGGKTNLLTRQKLSDGQYLCSKCQSGIPMELTAELYHCDYDDFLLLKEYMEKTNKYYSEVFVETCSYRGIHADTARQIYYLDSMTPRVYLPMEDISFFNLEFVPETAKEGLLRDTVTGDVELRLESNFPQFKMQKVIARGLKASANIRDGLFRKKVSCGNPKGMDEFLNRFVPAWQAALERKYERLTREIQEYQDDL